MSNRHKTSLASVGVLSSLIFLSSCDNFQSELKVQRAAGLLKAKITKVVPLVAKPGDVVQVIGTSFALSNGDYGFFLPLKDGTNKPVRIVIKDSTTGSFTMPEGAGLGLKTVDFQSNRDKLGSFNIIADQATNSLPIFIGDQSKICTTEQYIDKNGDTQTGTKDCAAGSSSTSSSVSDCKSDGEVGCKTTESFKAASASAAIAGNIKSGVTIAGVAGQYPSSTYPMADATSTADLDAATFNAKVKSATAFEYWDSSGSRQTGAGDADITAANIATGIDVFATSGTAVVASPNAWDVRAGVVVGSTTGLLKTDCRNGATLATFDMADYPRSGTADNTTDFITITGHGYADNDTVRYYDGGTTIAGLSYTTTYFVRNSTPNTFQVSLTSGGVAINFTTNGSNVFFYRYGNATTQIWDSIDDYLGAAVATPTYTGWSSNNLCSGLTTTASDPQVWVDVTTTGDGVTASNCTASAANCSIKDKITGHEWHKADTTSRNWTTALSFCDSLTYNGKTDWRLPTQKELMAAYNNGIASTVGGNWMSLAQMQQYYWSASSQSNSIPNAWNGYLGNGYTTNNPKNTTYRVICVRS